MSGRWADRPHGRALPPNWGRIQKRILRRDPQCTIRLPGCTHVSTEVDHIGDRDDHSDTNLRGACHDCHAKVTARQAAAGRAAARARRPRRRPSDPHPGLLPAAATTRATAKTPATAATADANVTKGWGVTPSPPPQKTGTA